MSNSRVVGMAFNKINSIDLTGLSPYTQVLYFILDIRGRKNILPIIKTHSNIG